MAKRTQHTIGLDIGTSRVTCIAGEPGEGNLLEVVGIGAAAQRMVLRDSLGELSSCRWLRGTTRPDGRDMGTCRGSNRGASRANDVG